MRGKIAAEARKAVRAVLVGYTSAMVFCRYCKRFVPLEEWREEVEKIAVAPVGFVKGFPWFEAKWNRGTCREPVFWVCHGEDCYFYDMRATDLTLFPSIVLYGEQPVVVVRHRIVSDPEDIPENLRRDETFAVEELLKSLSVEIGRNTTLAK